LDEETGLYYYGARYYDARSSVWLSADPLQEKYPNVSTYAYVGNNPVKFVDIDGRDFDPTSETVAQHIELGTRSKISELETRILHRQIMQESIDDLQLRVNQLQTSLDDIVQMRNNPDYVFYYSGVTSETGQAFGIKGPTTIPGTTDDGRNAILMFIEIDNLVSTSIHESRHGGDVARGDLRFNDTGGYTVNHEVSAYKAQYSYNGVLRYLDADKNPTSQDIVRALQTNTNPLASEIYNINNINANVVNSMSDPGTHFQKLYPPKNSSGVAIIPLNIWNGNRP
jgi:RHS repeat-associated protein